MFSQLACCLGYSINVCGFNSKVSPLFRIDYTLQWTRWNKNIKFKKISPFIYLHISCYTDKISINIMHRDINECNCLSRYFSFQSNSPFVQSLICCFVHSTRINVFFCIEKSTALCFISQINSKFKKILKCFKGLKKFNDMEKILWFKIDFKSRFKCC